MKIFDEKNAPGEKADALEMLTADHDEIKKLFKDFWPMLDSGEAARLDSGAVLDNRTPGEAKHELVRKACHALLLHSKLEEEIFYPAVRKALGDDELMNEAKVEHGAAEELINQLLASDPADELYDARFVVLSEQVLHHIRLEEGNMFPRAKDAGVDLAGLGRQMKKRRAELEAEMVKGDRPESGFDLSDARTRAAMMRMGLPV